MRTTIAALALALAALPEALGESAPDYDDQRAGAYVHEAETLLLEPSVTLGEVGFAAGTRLQGAWMAASGSSTARAEERDAVLEPFESAAKAAMTTCVKPIRQDRSARPARVVRCADDLDAFFGVARRADLTDREAR